MTRFPISTADTAFLDPIQGAIAAARDVLSSHGLVGHLASDRQIDDDLLGNVAAHMWACRFGIGLLEDRAGRGLNYNVILEVGAMLMTGRRCALLKDVTAPPLPSDIAGQVYKSSDFSDLDELRKVLHAWVREDLSLEACPAC
jgi:hypothetical protein